MPVERRPPHPGLRQQAFDAVSTAPLDARWRSHAAVLAVGTFAVGTDAFVVAGLLPSIAESLEVSVGRAGQPVTVFAVGNAFTALAPTCATVLLTRVVAAVGAALYTASATSAAAAPAGAERRGRAIAIVMLGITSSLVLGTPIGTVLGALLDWRARSGWSPRSACSRPS